MDVWEIISWGLMSMLLLRFGVVLVNWWSPVHLGAKVVKETGSSAPRVSILIPARNEAGNLPSLLRDLKNTDYPNFEIIVCNDHSTDQTLDVLESFSKGWRLLGYFDSEPLPNGWVGKNFACHQLAQKATGDWYLFLDADVRLNRDAIGRAVEGARRRGVSLLSVFPQQLMISKGERQTVPVMNWILLSMLPLVAVQLPWFPSLAAANGQFMLFEADAYRRHQWHWKVRNQNVEDIVISRTMKGQKLPVVVLAGDKDVFCRMYASREEAIHGFARNMHHFFGGHRLWMVLFVALAWVRLPYFALVGHWFFLAASVLMVLTMKVGVARISRQPVKLALFLHWPHLWSMTRMAITNMKNSKELTWKGRVYSMTNDQ